MRTISSAGSMSMYTLRPSPLINRQLQSCQRRPILLLVVLMLISMLLLLSVKSWHWGGSVALDEQMPGQPRYGIILDAGSTGSRVHVFEFRYKPGRRQPYILVNELFKQIRPGLSSFADRPHEAARSLIGLVDACKQRIPQQYWTRTPLALKATAGLRLLKADASKQILAEVQKLLASYPFEVGRDAVGIMDGLDEGIFSWVTLNFLNGEISHPGDSFGALDLGGGSTQVTFAASKSDTAPAKFLKNFRLGSTAVKLYSHSYLGLGLMSARLAVLRAAAANPNVKTNQLHSPCLPSNYNGTWQHAGVTYWLAGEQATAAGGSYAQCRKQAGKAVAEVQPLPGLQNKRFYAFSYFYDRAADLKLISAKDGGNVTLRALASAAQRVCTQPMDLLNPFLCLDSAFIVSLLSDGYRFPLSAEFVMRKKIHNVELSWALGAVFDVFYNHHVNHDNSTVA